MIFRSAARARRRALSRSAALPAPAISRRRSRSRARARAYIRYYNLPPQSVNRFIPRPSRALPPRSARLCARPLLRATYVHAPAYSATRPLPADSRHCLRFGFCALARRPRGRSHPRTRHESRPRRHKNQFSNIAPKLLFARRRPTPAGAAAAARLRRAMTHAHHPRHGRDRRKQPKTTLENSHFYKTSLKSGFFESTILSKSSKSRVVLRDMGG